jgi:phosphoserine phosphatase RsbU/P
VAAAAAAAPVPMERTAASSPADPATPSPRGNGAAACPPNATGGPLTSQAIQALQPASNPSAAPAPPPPPPVSDVQMRMVLDVSRLLAVPTDLDPLLCRIAEAATVLLGCERASIWLHDPQAQELWTTVALKSKQAIRVPCDAGIVGYSFSRNEIVLVPDPYADPRFNPEPDRRSGFVTRSLLTVPMQDLDGRPLGVIQAVNKVAGRFNETDTSLARLLAEQAGVAIQRHRLQMAAMEIIELRHEMDLARRTQEALIPKRAPDVPGVEAAGWVRPASVTGGDCFDLWKLPDGSLGVFIADASGHGLAPALVVSQVRTLARAVSEFEPDPHRLLGRVNARLAEDLEWGQFVTAFLGFLGPDGLLRWSSAGHGPILFRPRRGDPVQVVQPPVQPLGVATNAFADSAPPPLRLDDTGSLVLVSDGIFESIRGEEEEQFGVERLVEVLDGVQDANPAEVINAIRLAVRGWQGFSEPTDDQTIVVVRRDGQATLPLSPVLGGEDRGEGPKGEMRNAE